MKSLTIGDFVYSVEFETEPDNRWDNREIESFSLADVPRAAIRFFDVRLTTDMHQRNVFRHPIGLPDAMLPDAWKIRSKLSTYDYKVFADRKDEL
jgi:hypothetical protein